ncbi:MAG: type II toxin-antitoxin system Phd/YefM family antitoxin [Anaerolineae bacterium]|nr:type II toxin-antitoxin system Phd/YefM family antitoxin [Anaerolineae bacterium]
MNFIAEVAPISDLRTRQNELLAKLAHGPVILTQRGRGTCVLLSLDQYKHLLDELEILDDTVDALKAKLELATGEDEAVSWEEVEAELDAIPS